MSETAQTPETAGQAAPAVVVLYCQRACAAGQTPPRHPAADGLDVQFRMLPCSSKVETWHLLQIVDQGADAVELVCCPQGACQFLTGNDQAAKRVARARDLLDSIGMGAERIGLSRGANLAERDLLDRARSRAEAAAPLGANLMKEVKPQ